jgi:hypothetical protein
MLALLGTAGGLAAVALALGNTPDYPPQHLRAQPAQFTPEPRPKALTRAEAAQVWGATTRFLWTAVSHRQLRTAYDLVGRELRGGMTRAEWSSGANPVVPFPVASVESWTLAYAYRNDVALDLGLIARPGSDTVAKTFRIELQRRAAGAPWRVVSWMPVGISGPGNVRSIRATYRQAPPPDTTTLTAWWLAFPGALLALVVVLPAALWLRSWRTGRKAERAYRDAVGLS